MSANPAMARAAAVGSGREASRSQTTSQDRAFFGGIVLLALAAGLLFARSLPETYDGQIMMQVTESLFKDGSLQVRKDIFGFNTPYSSYGIGMSLLMLPPYAFAQTFGADGVSAAMDVNALLYAGTVGCVLAFAKLAGATRGQAAATAALVALGTMLLPYTATAFSEMGVAFAVAAGLVALQASLVQRHWAPLLAGAAAGLALLMRTDSLVLVVLPLAAAMALISRDRREDLISFGIALAPFFAIWAIYNMLRFGLPWRLGYEGPQTFNHPLFDGLLGLTVSPGRGLLWHAPFVVAALVGLRLAWSRSRLLVLFAVVLLVARLLFYSRWWAWNGGWNWGPRFLVPAMPVLAVGILEIVRRFPAYRVQIRAGLVALAVCTAGIQVAGAAVAYERADLVQKGLSRAVWDGSAESVSPQMQRFVSDQIDRWDLFPVTDHARRLVEGRDLAGKRLAEPSALVGVIALAGLTALAFGSGWGPPGRRPGVREASA